MVETLESYYLRFWKSFWKNLKSWPLDNVGLGLVFLIVPPIIIYLRNPDAHIDWDLIEVTTLLYSCVFILYGLVQLGATPKRLDDDREEREQIFKSAVALRDETIRILTEKPLRTPAEQHDYDTVKRALQLLGDKGLKALRHIRNHHSLVFGTYPPVLPPGLTDSDCMWVYNHCAVEGILTSLQDIGHNGKTFAVAPKMEKVLDELLYQDGAVSGVQTD